MDNSIFKLIKPIFVLSLGFLFGFFVFHHSFEQQLQQRDPAAINKKVYQIETYSKEELKNELSQKLKIKSSSTGDKLLKFTHLSANICRQYQNLYFTFNAEDVSTNGHSPELIIKAPCQADADPSEIATILIPLQQLLSTKPKNGQIHFADSAVTVTLNHTGEEWPKIWILARIKFQSSTENDSKEISYNFPERTMATHPIVMEF
ncbi:MAG: hypothetical protein ACK41T_05400 [Pseudobdellovibrio sp.]